MTVQPSWAIAVAPPAGPGGTTVPSAGPGGEPIQHTEMALVDLRKNLAPALNYPLTLVFEHAGPVTLSVPVGSATQG